MVAVSLFDSSLDTYVKQFDHNTISYSGRWFDLITRLYVYTLMPITTRETTGHITGFLPLYLVQSPLVRRRLVSLLFSDLCPLLAEDETSANSLIDDAVQLAQERGVGYLKLRTGVNEALARRPDLVEGNLYVRWLMPLSTDPDSIWSSLRKPIQRQIKKPQKVGVQVRIAQQRDDVAHYYRLHLQTRCRKHGMPAQPRRYFFELWDTFAKSGAMQLLLAEYEGRVIAGMVLLASGTSIRYAYGASGERYLNLVPNDLLMWTSIKLGCTQGYQTFDMGRTARDNEGLMIMAFPVFAVAAWHELRWLAQWLKIPAAAIGFFLVFVQGIFLLGQFYKAAADFSLVTAIKLLEPHWMRDLWLLSVFALAGAAMVAGLWVLVFAAHSLYQRVQV